MKMLLSFSIVFGLFGSTAMAAPNGEKILLDGSSLCASPMNPVEDGLRKLNADYFGEVVTSEEGVVTASIVQDPAVYNSAIMAPVRILGRVTFKMYRARTDGQIGDRLVCELKIEKTQRH